MQLISNKDTMVYIYTVLTALKDWNNGRQLTLIQLQILIILHLAPRALTVGEIETAGDFRITADKFYLSQFKELESKYNLIASLNSIRENRTKYKLTETATEFLDNLADDTEYLYKDLRNIL